MCLSLLSSKEAIPPASTTAGADSEELSHLPEDTQLVMVQQIIQLPVPNTTNRVEELHAKCYWLTTLDEAQLRAAVLSSLSLTL